MKYQLQLQNISKSYGENKANDNISLKIKPNSIHALLGENGAGKSTLVNIIYGLVESDTGKIFWEDNLVEIASPVIARRMGIGIVFQHFALFDSMSAVENIALGIDYHGNMQTLRERIIEICDRYTLQVDPNARVKTLSSGEKQRIEIIRCLLQQPKLLILDEPTSVLTPVETQHLFKTLNTLREDGCSILFIGHKLDEIKQVCSHATILRQGKSIGDYDLENINVAQIAQLMVGKQISDYAKRDETIEARSILTMRCKPTSSLPLTIEEIQIKSGCITGIAGIAGNGQDILMAALAGEIGTKNNIHFNGEDISNWGVAKRNSAGILFVPTERLGRAAIPQMTLYENALLGVSNRRNFLIKNALIKKTTLQSFSNEIIEKFDVRTKDNLSLATNLSGGNLQKFIVGRTILQNPKVLLIANPTWGVDISAAIFIRNQLIALRDQGVAVFVASEDLDEMFTICDEITVIKENNLSTTYPVHSLTKEQVGLMMTL